jgi:hypothetical protein
LENLVSKFDPDFCFQVENKRYLLIKIFNKDILVLLTIENDDLKILLRSDKINEVYLFIELLRNTLNHFKISNKDFLLLEKSRLYSKKRICKLLFRWFEFRLNFKNTSGKPLTYIRRYFNITRQAIHSFERGKYSTNTS